MNPVDLACKWFGHRTGNEYLGVRYSEADDGERHLSFYISVKCLRCDKTQEADVTGLETAIFTRSWMKRQVDFYRKHYKIEA